MIPSTRAAWVSRLTTLSTACSTSWHSLKSKATRWSRYSTLFALIASHYPLLLGLIDIFKPLSAVLSSAVNLSISATSIRRKIIGNAENRMPASWVNATSVLCCPRGTAHVETNCSPWLGGIKNYYQGWSTRRDKELTCVLDTQVANNKLQISDLGYLVQNLAIRVCIETANLGSEWSLLMVVL